jgi:hypothetical protein
MLAKMTNFSASPKKAFQSIRRAECYLLMQSIFSYIRNYFVRTDKKVFSLCTLIIALAVFVNYYFGLNRAIVVQSESRQIISWFFVFLVLFAAGYGITVLLFGGKYFGDKNFVLLLLVAPLMFSWKMAADPVFPLHPDPLLHAYWNQVIYWPFKLLVVTLLLVACWKLLSPQQPFYGAPQTPLRLKPYLVMLLVMIPLVAAASTQADFLAVYPKLKNISYLGGMQTGWKNLLFELAYGSDFITIELFFRGFLVLAFARFAGENAILPMAMFYCSIHFGKPLGECISSYFGGILLGIVIYNTKNIYGGLMVHLGIAWLMELGGWLGGGMG